MASNVRFLDQVPVSAYGNTTALTVNTGSFMVTGSASGSTLTFTKGNGTTFDLIVSGSGGGTDVIANPGGTGSALTTIQIDGVTYTISGSASGGSGIFEQTGSYYATSNDLQITGSLNISGSIGFLATTSSAALTQVAMYDTSSGKIYHTASSAIGSNTTYNSTASQVINNIIVKDFDADVTVTYAAGDLTFLFGTPVAPTPSLNINGFITDRFNKVEDAYTVVGNFGLGGYTLISASLFETTAGSTGIRATGDTGTSLSISPTTTGSRSYKLEVTSSNPADGVINYKVVTDSETLAKSNPTAPTIAFTPDVQLGAATNEIELGATGSIDFTPTLGSANSWVYATGTLSTNISSPTTVVYDNVSSILISASADYSSSGAAGSDNDPALKPSNFAAARPVSSVTTYTRIRSLRYGTSAKAAFTESELLDIETWDTSLGGSIGTIDKGKNTQGEINNQSVSVTWTGLLYQYFIYDAALPNLTQFDIAGNNYIGSFEAPVTVGGYKIYRTTNKQYAAGATTATYKLIF